MLLERELSRWWHPHPVASREALDLLHQVMHSVSYRCIAMAIKTVSTGGTLHHCCFVDCRPGGCRGNTEQVVARQRRPVVPNALDMLHQAKPPVLHRCTAMAIKMASDGRWIIFLEDITYLRKNLSKKKKARYSIQAKLRTPFSHSKRNQNLTIWKC